jgi:hypothetical protein
VLLVCSNLAGLLFGTLLEHGALTLWEVMIACVIMHNMIIEDEHDDNIYDQGWDYQGDLVEPEGAAATFAQFIQFHHEMYDRATHIQFQDDFIDHMWTHIGNQ